MIAAVESARINADNNRRDGELIGALIDLADKGLISAEQFLQAMRIARNADLDSRRSALETAMSASDPAVQTLLGEYEGLATDSSHPADEALRAALLLAIGNIRARAQTETQQAQAATATNPVIPDVVTTTTAQPDVSHTATVTQQDVRFTRREDAKDEARQAAEPSQGLAV